MRFVAKSLWLGYWWLISVIWIMKSLQMLIYSYGFRQSGGKYHASEVTTTLFIAPRVHNIIGGESILLQYSLYKRVERSYDAIP